MSDSFCDPVDCSPPGSSVHGVGCHFLLQGSFWPRDGARVSCIGRWTLYHWATREAPVSVYMCAFFPSLDHFSLIFIFCCHVRASLKLFPWLQSVNFCPSEHILIPHLQILSACNAGDLGLIPVLGRTPGEGKDYPPQYSGLENSMDYSPWGSKESDTTERLSQR